MHVVLDLYGVLIDHEKMFRLYRDRIAGILSARFDGTVDAWRRAHDEAFVAYVRGVNEADWDARGWTDIVNTLDERNLLDMFELAGVATKPDDALGVARQLERQAMESVEARYPDARAALERLRRAGHTIHVATGGSETADAALRGSGLFPLVDGLFTGHSQNASKSRAAYWRGIPEALQAAASDCILVDDRLDYLEAAASVGIVALLLDRKGAHRPESMPPYVDATLRNLAALPPWIEAREASARAVRGHTCT